MFRLDEAVSHLVDEAKPCTDLANIVWSWKVPDGLNVLVSRLDPLGCDYKPSELHSFFSEVELLRREHHPILVAMGHD